MDQLQQLVINEKSRMQMESQLSVAQDKIGAVERRTKLLEQKNENFKKNWTVGMRRSHQKLLPICNLLLVVVDFILLVCFVSQPYVAMSSPISMQVIGGPQVIPTPMSGPTLGPTPFGGP